jgi:hypothetical protein
MFPDAFSFFCQDPKRHITHALFAYHINNLPVMLLYSLLVLKQVQSQYLVVYQPGISILFFTLVDQQLTLLGCHIGILVGPSQLPQLLHFWTLVNNLPVILQYSIHIFQKVPNATSFYLFMNIT